MLATLNGATWHGLREHGAVAPGYRADLLLLPDLERFVPDLVLKPGRPVEEIPRPEVPEWVKQTVRVQHVSAADFALPRVGGEARVIGVVRDQIVTEALTAAPPFPDPDRDLAKIAVVERHLGTGRIGVGLVTGFGLGAARSRRRSPTTRTTSSSSAWTTTTSPARSRASSSSAAARWSSTTWA